MMLTFFEINSKLKGVATDITTRNMLTFRTTFHAYIVNRPVESVFSKQIALKSKFDISIHTK